MQSLVLALALAAAPSKVSPPVPPTFAATLAARDLKANVPYKDWIYTRYLFTWDQDEDWRRIWQLHMNLLSRDQEVQRVVVITPYLWRINIKDLRWNPQTWENGAGVDYVFHDSTRRPTNTPKPPHPTISRFSKKAKFRKDKIPHAGWLQADDILFLSVATKSQAPILVAEIVFNRSARQRDILNKDDHGVGYFDFLQLKSRKDYLKLVDVDVQNPDEESPFGREFRAALDKSGISEQNRQIVRFQGRGGGVWVTLDTQTQRGRGVALNNLRRGEFRHTAEEWYGPKADGLPVVYTCDDKGVQANVVPGDTHEIHDGSSLNEGKGKTVHSILSCNNCHRGQVLKDFKDDVRTRNSPGTWLGIGSVKKKIDREFRQLYLSDIYLQLVKDRLEYQYAVRRATILNPDNAGDKGLDPDKAFQIYSRRWFKYARDDVTVGKAARELGVTREIFIDALRNYARPKDDVYRLANVPLAGYIAKDPFPLSRLTWEDSYALAQDALVAYGLDLLKRDTVVPLDPRLLRKGRK